MLFRSESTQETNIKEDLSNSIHDGFECLDCHIYKVTLPHKELPEFGARCAGCKSCHEDAAQEYKGHGRVALGECEELPFCSDCHGGHKVLPSTEQLSKTHPANLPQTCGKCHEDLEITKKYEILIDHPIEIYEFDSYKLPKAPGEIISKIFPDPLVILLNLSKLLIYRKFRRVLN